MTKIMIIKLIYITSLQYGISPDVSLAVARNESNFNPNSISKSGDLGVFQLRAKSFPNYTKKQLLDPKTNITLGIKYLVKMKKECVFKNDNKFVICYNVGARKAQIIKHPDLHPYYVNFNKTFKAISL